jgi:hypothetical protein
VSDVDALEARVRAEEERHAMRERETLPAPSTPPPLQAGWVDQCSELRAEAAQLRERLDRAEARLAALEARVGHLPMPVVIEETVHVSALDGRSEPPEAR